MADRNRQDKQAEALDKLVEKADEAQATAALSDSPAFSALSDSPAFSAASDSPAFSAASDSPAFSAGTSRVVESRIESLEISQNITESGGISSNCLGDGEDPWKDVPDTNLLGQVLSDRYEIESLVGKGGMGKVYRARHTLMNRSVAVKVLHMHLIEDAQSRQRFQFEAKAASTLHHPNLIGVSDYGVTPNGQPFIVMDFVEGKTLLEQMSSEGPVSLPQFFDIFEKVCSAMSHAHAKGVIHRDLKPGNIMLTNSRQPDESVKLLDFGIAKLMPGNDGTAQHLTQTGQIFGSPYYMSPEQCNGTTIDERADIYSIGCVMFEALTGQVPFKGPTAIQTLQHHVIDKAPLVSSLRPGIMPDLEQVIASTLEKDPANRPQTFEELRERLEFVRRKSKLAPVLRDALSDKHDTKHLEPFKKYWKEISVTALAMVAMIFVVTNLSQQLRDSPLATKLQDVTSNEAAPEDRSMATEWIEHSKDKLLLFSTTDQAPSRLEEAARYARKAVTFLEKVAPRSSDYAAALSQLANVYLTPSADSAKELYSAKRAEAIRLIKKAIDVTAGDSPQSLQEGRYLYMQQLARAYIDEGNYKPAEEVLEKLKTQFGLTLDAKDPYHEPVLQALAEVYWHTGRPELAAKLEADLSDYARDKSFNPQDKDMAGKWFGQQLSLKLALKHHHSLTGNQLNYDTPDGKEETAEQLNGRMSGREIAEVTLKGVNNGADLNGVLVQVNDLLVWHTNEDTKGTTPYVPGTAIMKR